MTVLALVAAAMFGFASLAAIIRIMRGPTNIDRVVAADVLAATLVCWLGTWMIINQTSDLMPVLVVLAMFAIVGTVSVSRFLSRAQEDQ